jgi:DnaK suppressor protein
VPPDLILEQQLIGDPMSLSESLQNVSQRLEARAAELRQAIEAARSRTLNPHEVGDRADEAQEHSFDQVADAEIERDLAALREIDRARELIATGHYGQCTDCGAHIAVARLVAQPMATRCTACQSQAEQHHH